MVICVTGHRPNKMPQNYGYNLNSAKWLELKEQFKNILIQNKCNEAITGMALGVDTIFAIAVLELKQSGHNIKLHCAIPCLNHSSTWPIEAQIVYNQILNQADIIKIVSNKEYKPFLMQIRNEYMVDASNKVIAVWNGHPKGGTYNCVRYAEIHGKEIIHIKP